MIPKYILDALGGIIETRGRNAGQVSITALVLALVGDFKPGGEVLCRDGGTIKKGDSEVWISMRSVTRQMWTTLYREDLPDREDERRDKRFEALNARVKRSFRKILKLGLLKKTGWARPDLTGEAKRLYGHLYVPWSLGQAGPASLVNTVTAPAVLDAGYSVTSSRDESYVDAASEIAGRFADEQNVSESFDTALAGTFYSKRRVNALEWQRRKQKAYPDEYHITTGCWRRNHVGDAEKPCMVPFVVIELDGTLERNYDLAQELISKLSNFGVNPASLLICYSGNRSIHIRIPHALIGCPIYADANAARQLLQIFVRSLINDPALDVSVLSPLHLIRAVGSVHNKTKRRCVGFYGDQFGRMSLSTVVQHSFHYTPVKRFRDPSKAKQNRELTELFIAGAQENIKTHRATKISAPNREIIAGIESGVSTNRNNAAFKYSLSLHSGGGTYAELAAWNQKNFPPLAEHELRGVFDSAQRYAA